MKTMKILFAAMIACGLLWQACQKEEEATQYKDVETTVLKTGSVGFDCLVDCIDADAPEYFEVHDQLLVGWGGRNNTKFSKTVEVKYYNTLTHFVLKVMSSNGIADVLMDDESIKNFEGTIPPDEWHEFSFELEADWEACDIWAFELKIAGFGPPAYFDVTYQLIGEYIYYTLDLAVYPEGAGTVSGAGEYKEDEAVELSAIANEGWEFVNWTDEDDAEISNLPDFTYTMPAYYATLTANFEETTFELSLAVNPEDAGTVAGQGEYTEGEEVALTATANEGYVFVNWTDGDDAEISNMADFTYTMPAYDVTLTAKFEEEDEDPGFTCGDNITFTYRGQEVTYGTVLSNGLCWLDRNLGASQVATSSTDADAFGDLFQWGRLDDGHQDRNSPTTTTLSSSNTPGHGNFILAPSDWRSPRNDNLWQGVSGVNNPCPAGYRLPTEAELEAEQLSWSSNNAAGAFASLLKLPLAGGRNRSGSLEGVGSGVYWSSTVTGAGSHGLFFISSEANMGSYYRALGYSVRCLKD